MSRTKESPSLSNRTGRLPLKVRREPYWLVLEKGRALGYRKGKNGGTWIARYYDPLGTPPRPYEALGAADDTSDADGKMVLNFSQAQEAARNWFEIAYFRATGEKIHKGSYKVSDAIEDYIADRKRNGVATANRMHYDFDARVIPYLGTAPVKRLTKKKIEDWMDTIILLPVRHRGKEGLPPETEEEFQSRKSTANRIWKNLRAALNLAAREGKVQTS